MKHKISKFKEVFEKCDIDALVISDIPNLEYVFEVKEPYCVLVIFRDLTYIVYVSELDYPRLIDLIPEKDNVIVLSRRGYSPFTNKVVRPKEIAENLKEVLRECTKVGYDKRVGFLKKLEDKKLVEASEHIGRIRRRKDAYEIERIKRAVKIAEKALEEVSFLVKPSVREVDLEAEIVRIIHSHEAEPAFKVIVASGPNSAIPHHVSSRRRISRGDVVVIDLGARVSCYCSDITRTFVVGAPSQDVKDVIYAVAEAQKKAMSCISAGVSCEDVDRIARQVLREYGLEQYFIHGLGHGLGVEVHESPSLSPESEDKLEVGDVVTVEPGVYKVGMFGVRIEDDVYVTDRGPQVLTSFPRILI